MNKRNCAAGEAAYVALNGRWICGGCGCVNQGGSSCVRCGWNGSGCCGGVVRTGDACRRTRCCAEQRSTSCRELRQAENCDDQATLCADTACADAVPACQPCSCAEPARTDGRYKNQGVGMVWAVEQELDRIYSNDRALCHGTLFPELHKPMNGYRPGRCACQDEEQAAAFAVWELRLYLNTHPDDACALALYRRLCRQLEKCGCADAVDGGACAGWNWVNDPWPWTNPDGCC